MKKIDNMLAIFKADPDSKETCYTYERRTRNWNSLDINCFWELALKDYPDNTYKKLAECIAASLKENELVEPDEIIWDFIHSYKESGAKLDVGLTTHILDYIEHEVQMWVDDYYFKVYEDSYEKTEKLEKVLEDADVEECKDDMVDDDRFSDKVLSKLYAAERKCWYWNWLLKDCLRASGIVEDVIGYFHA